VELDTATDPDERVTRGVAVAAITPSASISIQSCRRRDAYENTQLLALTVAPGAGSNWEPFQLLTGRRTTYALRDLAGVHGRGLTLGRQTGLLRCGDCRRPPVRGPCAA